jgi:hypothetical protein
MEPGVRAAKKLLSLFEFEEQSEGYNLAVKRGMSERSLPAKMWRTSLLRKAYDAGLISEAEARRAGALERRIERMTCPNAQIKVVKR